MPAESETIMRAQSTPTILSTDREYVIDNLIFIIALAYLTSLTFEGPVRYLLNFAGLQSALYLRDVFAFITVAFVAIRSVNTARREQRTTLIIFYLLIIHLFIGIWLGRSLFPALFAFKLFLATMFGTAAAASVHKHKKYLPIIFTILFLSATAGVYLNKVLKTFPWEGEEFETAFGVVKTTTVWWSGGERRLSGFARASFSAASIIGIAGAFLMLHVKNFPARIFILALGAPAIYLTTSKGMLLSYLVVGLLALSTKESGRARIPLAKTLIIIFAITAAAAPILSALIAPNPILIRTVPSQLSSFMDRASVTWPMAVSYMSSWYNLLLGMGLGGAGGSLKYGPEYLKYNPIDNLFLYLFVNFGLAGSVYYIIITSRLIKATTSTFNTSAGIAGIAIAIYCYGITAHLFEDAFVSIILGILIGWPKKQDQSQITCKP